MRVKGAVVQEKRITRTAGQQRTHALGGRGVTRRITRKRVGKRERGGGGDGGGMTVVWVDGCKVRRGEETRRWRWRTGEEE